MYYDANTGFYYCFDAESGRYQFHSRIEVAAAEPIQDKSAAEKKSRKLKKGSKKSSHQENKV